MAKRRKPGPNGDRLKVEADWKGAVKTALGKPKPPENWPERPIQKRKRCKKK